MDIPYSIVSKLIKKPKFTLKVEGKSMLPLLCPGDVLELHRTTFKKTKVNDVVLVIKNRKYFIHRVIYKTDKYLVTKGDNNRLSDGKIRPKNIIAKLGKVKRGKQEFFLEDIYLVQSTLYFQEIVKIKKAFEREKIDFVFLKGLPLHLYYEGTHPRRIYADCDILISPIYYQKAEELFKRYGYQKSSSSLWSNQKIISDKFIEISFLKKINDFPIVFDIHRQVHFMINQLGTLDALYPEMFLKSLTDNFLAEKNYIKVHGELFPILSNVNLVIYLSLHIFRHNFIGSYLYEFSNRVISKMDNKKWTILTERILKYRLQNFIYPAFQLLSRYYHPTPPQNYFKLFAPDKNKKSYIDDRILKINIFDHQERIKAGIQRLKMSFILSSYPFYRKALMLISPFVLISILRTILLSLRKYLTLINIDNAVNTCYSFFKKRAI